MNKHNWQEQNAYKMHIVANGSVPKKNIKGKLSFQLVPSDDLRRHFLPLESSNDSQPKMVLSIKKIFILLGVSGEDRSHHSMCDFFSPSSFFSRTLSLFP